MTENFDNKYSKADFSQLFVLGFVSGFPDQSRLERQQRQERPGTCQTGNLRCGGRSPVSVYLCLLFQSRKWLIKLFPKGRVTKIRVVSDIP